DAKATDAAFAKAAHVVALELINNRVVVNSMEPRNAVADYDPQSGRSTLYTATQGPHFVRDPLAELVLKMPKDMLRLITPNVGGGFGMKAFVYPEHALVVWASRKLKRPVKWQEDRSEAFISDNQGRDHAARAELALDENGRFLGLRVSILANLGAYLSPFGSFVPTRSTDLVSGLYAIGAIHINVKGICTNTVPVCAYRGAGRPEAAYLLERLVDAAARDLGMSPDRIRRVNFVPSSAMPYTSATKLLLDSGEFEKVMDRCMAAAEWPSFARRRTQSERNGKLRGIGMATYTERCGGGFPETASIEFKDDRVELIMGNQEYGTGLLTAYKQLVSEQLGIDADRIDIVMGDTDRTPSGLTGGSRALAVAGSALYEAGLAIIEKGRQLAAHVLEVSAQDVSFNDGVFGVPGTDLHLNIFEAAKAARDPAKLPPGMATGLDTTHTRSPPAQTFPNGCHTVEVEIDPNTGAVTIERYQPAAARGSGAWRRGARCRSGTARTCDLRRRERATSVRLVHGLLDAAGRRCPVIRLLDPQRTDERQSARRQGRRRSGRSGRAAGGDECDHRCARPSRWRAPHRYAGNTGARVGGSQWRVRQDRVLRPLRRPKRARAPAKSLEIMISRTAGPQPRNFSAG
ncbi:MAG TPA: molybdopterin cofactor-binding domain-containing protein, partial [Bradyrhizobium sp.]|nr:molybdopterin cofactor-binding domain-containing protein [Bradyrhizobium sp.]